MKKAVLISSIVSLVGQAIPVYWGSIFFIYFLFWYVREVELTPLSILFLIYPIPAIVIPIWSFLYLIKNKNRASRYKKEIIFIIINILTVIEIIFAICKIGFLPEFI